MGNNSKKPSRRKLVTYASRAAAYLSACTPCHILFYEHGKDAGFEVGIPLRLYEPEDQAAWDAFKELHADLDEAAYGFAWDELERELDRERRGLTAAQAVEWLRSKHDEAAALMRKRFEEQVSKFLEDAAECGADELAKEGRRAAKLKEVERQLMAEESQPLAAAE